MLKYESVLNSSQKQWFVTVTSEKVEWKLKTKPPSLTCVSFKYFRKSEVYGDSINFQEVYLEFSGQVPGERTGTFVPGRSNLIPLFSGNTCTEFLTPFL